MSLFIQRVLANLGMISQHEQLRICTKIKLESLNLQLVFHIQNIS